METNESTQKKCNRCGKILVSKSSLKRHKKKCKVIKITSEMDDLSMKPDPDVICQMCFRKTNNINKHVKICSELRKHLKVFNTHKPSVGYFGQVDISKLPVQLIVELLKKVPTAEKMYKFRSRCQHVGLTFVDMMILKKCSFPIWKQFFTDVSFDVLLDTFFNEADALSRIDMIIPSLPDFPLDVLEYAIDHVAPEHRSDILGRGLHGLLGIDVCHKITP